MKRNFSFSDYPKRLQHFFNEENKLVRIFSKGAKSILDVGCGSGRVLPIIAPIVESYHGIDLDEDEIQKAKHLEKKYKHARFDLLDAEHLSKALENRSFEKVILCFCTLGSTPRPEKVLSEIGKISNKLYLSFAIKGELKKRERIYSDLKLSYKTDQENETIYSGQWTISRAYTIHEIEMMLKKIGFEIYLIKRIAGAYYGVIAKKQEENE